MRSLSKNPLLIGLVSLLIAGCSFDGVSARIRENPAQFARLTAGQQAYIRRGEIRRGFTPDMVYFALGKPTEIKQRQFTDGTVEMWIYDHFSGRSPGPVLAPTPPQGGNSQALTSNRNAVANTVQPYLSIPDPTSMTLLVVFVNGHVQFIKHDRS